MVNSKEQTKKKKGPKVVDVTSSGIRAATGTVIPELQNQLVTEVIRSSGYTDAMSEQEKDDLIASAYAALQGIGPTTELEGMLAAQMVGTHSAAMNFLSRAGNQEANLLWREFYMKHATKLLSLYLQQVAALDKHRGKGQQKVTVEHVHVEQGGQAIVGNVEASKKFSDQGCKDKNNSTKLEDNPGNPFKVGTGKKNRAPHRRK